MSTPTGQPRGTTPRRGTRLGPYELVAPLGAGGMGEVFRARDTRLDREVAVKVLDLEAARHPERLRLFEQEARAAGAIAHPSIVTVHDVGREGETPYVVFELLEGQTLRSQLDWNRLSLRKALEIGIQIGQGLAAAHARGILHNDLKPENILLCPDGRVKILDFGLAGLRRSVPVDPGKDSDSASTAVGGLWGSAGYVAPQQIRGEDPDARSDVFSLGAILYEMVSGQRAFPGTTAEERVAATLDTDPPEASAPILPPAIALVVRRALEKRPGERFQSAADLAFALEAAAASLTAVPEVPPTSPPVPPRRGLGLTLGALAVVGVAAGALWLGHRLGTHPLPDFQRLTVGRGGVTSARFAADGNTVVYAAAWDGAMYPRLFLTRTDTRGARELGVGEANIASISTEGELALILGRGYGPAFETELGRGDTLASVPLTGGAPRMVLSDVVAADWAPERNGLAVVRDDGQGGRRLEFPIGRVLHEAPYGLRAPRVSPDGQRVALIEGSLEGHSIAVVELDGRHTVLASGFDDTSPALAWSPDGSEVWFSGRKLAEGPDSGGWTPALRAVSLRGRERVVLRLPEFVTLHDVSADGRVLATVGSMRSEVIALRPGESRERNLSWHEGSSYMELTRDGRHLLFFEEGELATYLRPTDGGPPVRLCAGYAAGLSPDGRWVALTGLDHFSGRLTLVPTGAEEPRVVAIPKIAPWAVYWFADGHRFLITGHEEGQRIRAWVVDTRTGDARPLTPEGIGCWLVSPDGTTAACARPEGEGFLYPIEGGEPRPTPGFQTGDHMRQWSDDGRYLYVSVARERPAKILRIDLETGERLPWREIIPADPAGLLGTIDPSVTPDGSAFAYALQRQVNDLYVIDGLF